MSTNSLDPIPWPEVSVRPPTGPLRHSEYYLTDDSANVILLVEDTLYKIHKYQLIRASGFMRKMFSAPPGDNPEGASDNNPIRPPFPEVQKVAFDAFLDFQYFGMYSERNPLTITPIDRQHDWETLEETTVYHLLKFCIFWDCENIVKEIIRAVDAGKNLHPVFKIKFAMDPDFDPRMKHWIKPAYDKLVNRPRSLSAEEIDLLGPQRAAIIWEFREYRFDRESRSPSRDANRWFYTSKFSHDNYGVPELGAR